MANRALVIDDEPGIREILRYFLESAGWEVTTASNGEEGLRVYGAAAPRLVLVDGSMPGLNGYETARRLRELPGAAPTIVMLTGDGAPHPSPAALATHGIDRYFTKPFDDQEMMDLLDGLAEGGEVPT